MLQERKRFNYLSNQQRALNATNNLERQKSFGISKIGSIQSSNCKSHYQKKQQNKTNQNQFASSRKSSINRSTQPLNDSTMKLEMNKIVLPTPSNDKNKDKYNVLNKNKQNINEISLSNKQNRSQNQYQLSTINNQSDKLKNLQQVYSPSTESQRIKQLQEQNRLLIKNQEQKYMQMFHHLQKVQAILKQKQMLIEKLKNYNDELNMQNFSLKMEKKNQEILQKVRCYQEIQIQTQTSIQEFDFKQSNCNITEQKIILELQKQYSDANSQTQLDMASFESLLLKFGQSSSQQQPSKSQPSKNQYRQKYQQLFKKAIQMQDEICCLKEKLFDSQTEMKIVQQQFNTYKILNQIEKINMKQQTQ